MKRSLFIISSIMLIFMSSIIAQNGNRTNSKELQGVKSKKIQKALNLTEVQETKIRDLRFENQKLVLDIKNKIDQNKLVIRKMMADNKIDDAKLISISKENNELNGKIKLSKTKVWLDVYNILEDTQKVVWTEKFGRLGKKDIKNKSKKNLRDRDCNRF